MKRLFEYGGIVASAILIAVGAGAIAAGALGIVAVRDALAREDITATADAEKLGVDLDVDEKVDTGSEAREFARIVRTHALEATGGRTYAEMGRYLTADGEETDDIDDAARDEQGRPVENGRRSLWVTATALTTALNASFLLERAGLFSILIGVALLLAGAGFLALALGGGLRSRLR